MKILGKFEGLARLIRWMRVTANWREVWKYQRQKDRLPPIELRSGEVLHHGPHDSPLLLLDEVWAYRWYEFPHVTPPDALMLDIGANIGSVSLYWSQRVPNLRIHCYEPNPSASVTLKRNVIQNSLESRVTIHPEGVGRSAGVLRLWVDIPTDLSSAYMDKPPVEGGRRIEVPVLSVDDAWQRAGGKAIWLLKVDTEGAEVDILEGASPSFWAAVQNAIVEYHDNIVPGSLARCQRVLEAAGLRCNVRHHPWKEGIIYAHRTARV